MVEIAQALAARIVRERPTPASDGDRIDHAFKLCLSRPPTVAERSTIEQLLRRECEEKPDGSSQDHAWSAVARVLLNLDEFVTRE